MARAFANIGFTPNVKKVQADKGSRHNYAFFEQGAVEEATLGDSEQAFIAARDSFYMATINENGWPYVQHRGGPRGFLKVLDPRTIGFADFSGNRQYLSVGNLLGDDRVSMILMNYPERQRLKIWGRARIVDEATEPELVARVESMGFRAPVERAIIISIEAFDWNCPKYITPRYTIDEVEAIVAARTKETPAVEAPQADAGIGSIPLIVTAVRQLTDEIRGYEFRHTEGESLPDFRAGAHIDVEVRLPDGSRTRRSYSLASAERRTQRYRIAVKREAAGEGGSTAIHATWQVGTRLNIDVPVNYFRLHDDQRPTVLIASGIGITPIRAMAEELRQRNATFELHYVARSIRQMAFREELAEVFPAHAHFYFSQEGGAPQLDLDGLFAAASRDTLFYLCGPNRLIVASVQAAARAGIARDRISFESFQ